MAISWRLAWHVVSVLIENKGTKERSMFFVRTILQQCCNVRAHDGTEGRTEEQEEENHHDVYMCVQARRPQPCSSLTTDALFTDSDIETTRQTLNSAAYESLALRPRN